mmetsp:Transcript_20638/g.57500  ORF Transcript_20638/g.57500 Transcript_20638/m.57500 type:complete len:344 (-) Transcript_20638:115-1146(-)
MAPTASKEKALARLAGLNLVDAFDVEGKGTIDPVVLARVLKRFDGEVFTDDSVSELLKAWSGDDGETAGEGKPPDAQPVLQIKKIASVVEKEAPAKPKRRAKPMIATLDDTVTSNTGKAVPLVPRSPSCSKHAAVLDDYIDGIIVDLVDFREAANIDSMAAASGDSPEDMENLKRELIEKAKQYILDAQRRGIKPVWEAFDRDQDGLLSMEECGRLVTAYLKALVPKIGEMVRGTIELGVELRLVMFEKQVEDASARQRMRDEAVKQVDTTHAKIEPLAQDALKSIALEDPTTIAAELLQDLDANKDGSVTREEFESRFVEAIQQVLSPERLMAKFQKGAQRG